MFDPLTDPEIAVLKQLAEKGAPMAETRLDATALRGLAMRRYVRRLSGFSVITREGRDALSALGRGARPASPMVAAAPAGPFAPAKESAEDPGDARDGMPSVNATQEDMLRQLAQAEAPVPFDDLDGRVVRALEGRGLVERAEGMVLLSALGKAFYDKKVRRRRRARSGWARTSAERPAEEPADDRVVRARSIRDAVDALRRAVGGADALELGDLTTTADEAFAGLMELADRIERGADPRRITRR